MVKKRKGHFPRRELPEGIESMASSGALTRGVCSEAPKQSFKPFFKALKESKSRGDWCLRCKSFIELLDVFLGTRFIRFPGLRILKGCLGLSKTVISGRLVHDYRGLGCDDCGAMEKPKEHHFLLCGFLL